MSDLVYDQYAGSHTYYNQNIFLLLPHINPALPPNPQTDTQTTPRVSEKYMAWGYVSNHASRMSPSMVLYFFLCKASPTPNLTDPKTLALGALGKLRSIQMLRIHIPQLS